MNKDGEVNVQELDYQEIKKEENKMKEQFIKVNLPVGKVKLLTDAIRVEYGFEDKIVYFYINSKFAFLNRSKDNNYYFTLSLKRDGNYIYYHEENGLKDKIEVNGQELTNLIKYGKEKSHNFRVGDLENVI